MYSKRTFSTEIRKESSIHIKLTFTLYANMVNLLTFSKKQPLRYDRLIIFTFDWWNEFSLSLFTIYVRTVTLNPFFIEEWR